MSRAWAAIAAVALVTAVAAGEAGSIFDEPTLKFARQVNAEALALVPVQYHGRVAIIDTAAREELAGVYGQRSIAGTRPAFGYMELHFNSGLYVDRPVLYVRSEKMRALLAGHLGQPQRAALLSQGKLAPAHVLGQDGIAHLLATDRAEPADFVRARRLASLAGPLAEIGRQPANRLLLDRLQSRAERFIFLAPIAIPTGRTDWLSPDHLAVLAADFGQLDRFAEPVLALAVKWVELGDAWRARDAETVNRLVRELTARAAEVAGPAYPSRFRGRLEYGYNRAAREAISLAGFAVSFVLLVAAVATSKSWVRVAGLAAFAAAAVVMLVSFVARWVLSGRAWYLPPMMNQYEAVTASVLLGSALALVLEFVRPRNVFAMAAGVYAVVALAAALLLGEHMSPAISAAHGILNSGVMAAHVAVIIVGHAMAGMTGIISLAYLLTAAVSGRSEPAGPDAAGGRLSAVAGIDRANLIVCRMAVWALVAGTGLGAYWAYLAWGRWWGWDNKETWALITCLIYVAVLHLRFAVPARWRGPATAVGCLVGCGAMLFNWIVVNYLLPGLHSYG